MATKIGIKFAFGNVATSGWTAGVRSSDASCEYKIWRSVFAWRLYAYQTSGLAQFFLSHMALWFEVINTLLRSALAEWTYRIDHNGRYLDNDSHGEAFAHVDNKHWWYSSEHHILYLAF